MKISKINLVSYIVLFTFFANAFLGYSYTNILIASIPLNEILLIITLILINKEVINILYRYPIVIFLVIWSLGYLLLSVPFGFMKYGIWAGRDATHLIEIWWLIVSIYLFERIDIKKALTKILKILFIFFIIKFIFILAGDSIKGIFVIHGAQGNIDLFGSKTGINLIIFIVLFSYLLKLYRSVFVLIIILFFIAILQGRTIYIGLLSAIILYVLMNRFSILKVLKIFLGIILMLILLYSISFMTFLNDYTRFGIESIAPHNILLHLLASTGNSEEYAASAHGTLQRVTWFLINWNRAMADSFVLFFGQGFGVVLTDFSTMNIVREPHNSFLSVFARTGLVGLTLWITFHVFINTKALMILSKYRKMIKYNIYLKYLFICFFTMQAMYWFSLVEPGFESPQTCINFYILLGLMVFLVKNLKLKVKNV